MDARPTTDRGQALAAPRPAATQPTHDQPGPRSPQLGLRDADVVRELTALSR